MAKPKGSRPKPPPEGMPAVEIPNEDVASAADQFRETAEFLLRHVPKLNCVLPLMTVGTLGIELYLKSLNSRSDYHELSEGTSAAGGFRVTAEPQEWGHSLGKLFDALDPTIQEELRQSYDRNRAENSAATIQEALASFEGVFGFSRYSFENHSEIMELPSLSALVALAVLLGRFVAGLPKRYFESPNSSASQ